MADSVCAVPVQTVQRIPQSQAFAKDAPARRVHAGWMETVVCRDPAPHASALRFAPAVAFAKCRIRPAPAPFRADGSSAVDGVLPGVVCDVGVDEMQVARRPDDHANTCSYVARAVDSFECRVPCAC